MSLYTSFATGRTRTLKLEGSFSAPVKAASVNVRTIGTVWIGYWNYGYASSGTISWNGFLITFSTVTPAGSAITGNQHFHSVFNIRIDSTGTGFSGGENHVASVNFGDILVLNGGGTGTPPPGDLLSGTNSGTFSIEFDVEEWYTGSLFTPIADSWPPVNDGVIGLYGKFRERLVVGTGTVRVSVLSSAGNYSKSFNNPTSGVEVGSYQPQLHTQSTATGRYPGGDSVTIQASCAGIAIGYPRTYTFNDTTPPTLIPPGGDTWAPGSYPSGGYTNDSTNGAKTSMLSGWEATGAAMTISALPPMTALMTGSVKDFGGSNLAIPGAQAQFYQGGFTVPVDVSSGGISSSALLQTANLTGFGPFTGFSNFSEYKMYGYIQAGEYVSDTALVAGWKTWDALTITQASSLSVDTFSSTSGWAAGANTTVTSGGSTVSLAASGGSGSATRTYSPIKNTEGYRYLDLKFRSTVGDNVTIRVTVGQKYWDVVSDVHGTYKTFTIDLMAPDGTLSVLPIQQDTRWPVDNATSNIPVNENHFWGVNRITTFIVSNIPNGETIELDDSTLARKRTVTSHLSSTQFDSGGTAYLPGPFPPFVSRFLLCQTDGRQSLEASKQFASIDAFILECQKIPGFTVTNLTGGSFFGNTNCPPYFLGGGEGILLDGTSYLETDISSAQTIKAQFLLDVLGFYPGCGDILGSGGYGATATLPLLPKVLRGSGHGLVIDGSSKPVVGQTVKILRQPGAVLSGQGVSDVGGYYLTKAPYGKGGSAFDFVGSPPVTNQTIPPRKKVRVQVGPFASVTDIDEHQTWRGEHLLVFISTGDIWFRRSPHTGVHWTIETNITGSATFTLGWARPRVYEDLNGRVHILAYHTNQGGSDVLATGLYYIWSDDSGNTFGPITSSLLAPQLILTMATAGMTRGAIDGPMMQIIEVPDSGTSGPSTFQGRWRPNPNKAWSSFVTLKDDSAVNLHSAGYQWGFDKATESADRWSLSFVKSGDTMPTTYFCADPASNLTWKAE